MKDRGGMGHERDRIRAWLDGELAADAAARVREHCATCPDCAGALAELTVTWDALGQAASPPPPRAAWPGVRAALAARSRARVPRLRLAAGGAAAALAGLAIGLALGIGNPASPAGGAEVAVPEGGSLLVGTAAPTLEGAYAESGATTSD